MLRTNLSPERILIFGPSGAGKTRAWLTIAQLAQQTGSPAKFHVLDTDFDAVRRMTEAGEFSGLTNLVATQAVVWEEADNWAKNLADLVAPGDFVIVDMIGTTWTMVQDSYVERIFGEDPADYYLRAREAIKDPGKGLQVLSGWTDWTVIKKLYNRFIMNIFRASVKGAHLIFTSSVDRIESSDDKETKALFAGVSVKPAGEKSLPHKMHTIIYANYTPGTWTMTTIKDRARIYWSGQKISNFAAEYLVGVAGWQL